MSEYPYDEYYDDDDDDGTDYWESDEDGHLSSWQVTNICPCCGERYSSCAHSWDQAADCSGESDAIEVEEPEGLISPDDIPF